MIDYTLVLTRKFPGTNWNFNGDDYEGLVWLDESAKPTKEILDNLWLEIQTELEAEVLEKAQAKAALLERLGLTQEEFNTLIA
jgi:hypothetical protein